MTGSSANGSPVTAGTVVRNRRQQRAQATADQLLVAARSMFEQHGYRATTVGAITSAANTAHGTFYLYFKNKEDAFGRVIESVLADLARESTTSWDGDPRESLRRSIGGFFGVIAEHRGLWRCLMEGMLQSESIERMWLEMRRPYVERAEQTLRFLVDAKAVRPLDTVAAAAAFGNMVEWSAFTMTELQEPKGVSRERTIDAIVDMWHTALFGTV